MSYILTNEAVALGQHTAFHITQKLMAEDLRQAVLSGVSLWGVFPQQPRLRGMLFTLAVLICSGPVLDPMGHHAF